MYNLGGDLMRQQASLKPKVILKHNIALNQKMSQQLRILSFNNNELESFIEQFARDNIFTKIKYKTDNKDDLSWVKDLTTGLPMDTVPDTIFKGLENNDFYILTHKGIAPLVVKRAKDAVEGKAPNLAELMKYPDKTHTDTTLTEF